MDVVHALILHNGVVKKSSYEDQGRYDGLAFTDSDGNYIPAPEDDSRFDIYYEANEDSDIFHNVIHVLAVAAQEKDLPSAKEYTVPDPQEVQNSALKEIAPAIEAVTKEKMCGDDLTFALNVMKNSSFLYTHWKASGHSIPDAQRTILKSVFNLR